MAGTIPLWKQRRVWTAVVALVAVAFWIMGIGAGWRGWILTPFDTGVVAHAQGFGAEAFIWWMPATVISLTAVLMALGISVVRHLIGDPVEAVPESEPLEPFEPLEPATPLEAVTPVERVTPVSPVDALDPPAGAAAPDATASSGESTDRADTDDDDGPDTPPGDGPGTDPSR